MSHVKVFAMNPCDWMAAESLEEAKAAYLKDYVGGPEDDETFDDPHEVAEEAMRRMIFHDEDGTDRTFRAELDRLVADGAQFPRFFASTEY